MIFCGTMIRVKENRPHVEQEYAGEVGYIHSRSRMLPIFGSGKYEIRFAKEELNNPIMGVVGGFTEDDLEVI
jgi:hypothetical protein